MNRIVKLYGVSVSIVSDGDSWFILKFWYSLHKALGTQLSFNIAFLLQIDGQLKRTIKILDDML